MNWQPNVKIKDRVDIYHPSFPWKEGKPDWDTYRIIKAEERTERNKRSGKTYKIHERCCALEDGKYCGFKSLGKVEITLQGETKLAPLCQKHKSLYGL